MYRLELPLPPEPRHRLSNNTQNDDKRFTNWSLVQLMREARLRAPHRPMGCSDFTVLYRGINLPEQKYQYFVEDRVLMEPSFSSFSVQKLTSLEFATQWMATPRKNRRNVLLRLRVSQVRPGTPWLWFAGTCGGRKRDKNRLPTTKTAFKEEEVVLPPGVFTMLKPPLETTEYIPTIHHEPVPMTVIEVSFVPDLHARSFAYKTDKQQQKRYSYVFPRARRQLGPPTANRDVNGYVPLYKLLGN